MNTDTTSLLDQAIIAHRASRLADAERLYCAVLQARPADIDANAYLAMLYMKIGRHDLAATHYRRALAAAPARTDLHAGVASALTAQGDVQGALQSWRALLALDENHLEALKRTAEIFAQSEDHQQSLGPLRRMAMLMPFDIDSQVSLGNGLALAGLHEEAAAIYRKTLEFAADSAVVHVNLGNALTSLGRLDEAEAAHRAALALEPENPLVLLGIGNTLTQHERLEEAIAFYRHALRVAPGYPKVRGNLGIALCRAGQLEESMAVFQSIEPTPPASAPAHKFRHDAEQDAFLAAFTGAGDGARVAGAAVNPDTSSVAARWAQSDPKIVSIDNLLSPEALNSLRDYCMAARVWNLPYENGYLGAMPDGGFGAPIIAQIAEDLRAAYPGIFLDYPLFFFWGYKYDSSLKGINIHGDDAMVNVNFWLTPDDANLDPQSGGLVVWDIGAPQDWSFNKYNGNKSAIVDFLKQQGARPVTVPHRQNRAVIFQSDLFHETDKIVFRQGYENRRINITMLFGKRGV